ncbi:MAG: hypothetical protein IJ565_01010 [Bacilli bacterium]|nr:hypothetical protein [Bacilli bacterium]
MSKLKFDYVDLEFIKKYINNNGKVLLKPFKDTSFKRVKMQNGGLVVGYVPSEELVPFKHDFVIDEIDSKSYSINELYDVAKKTNNHFMLGELSNITNDINIHDIFFNRITDICYANGLLEYKCNLLIEKKDDRYISSLTYNYLPYNTNSLPFISGYSKYMESSFDALGKKIDEYGKESISNLINQEKQEGDYILSFEINDDKLDLVKKLRLK